jgi:hypothetical protein
MRTCAASLRVAAMLARDARSFAAMVACYGTLLAAALALALALALGPAVPGIP